MQTDGWKDRQMDGWRDAKVVVVVVRGRVLQLLPHVIVWWPVPPLHLHKTDLEETLQSGESALSSSI